MAWAAPTNAGELVLGGALTEPVDTALLLFKGDSPRVAEAFAESDPYVLNGPGQALGRCARDVEDDRGRGETAANPAATLIPGCASVQSMT
jgi:hypothetical protein